MGGSRWGPERASFSIWGIHLRLRTGPVGFCMSMLCLIILRYKNNNLCFLNLLNLILLNLVFDDNYSNLM